MSTPPARPNPIDQLSAEHRLMFAVLDAMARECRSLQSFDLRLDFWLAALEWLELFADRDHHEREELVLFPELERAGLSRAHGPLAQVCGEHERARAVRGQMVQSLAAQDAPGLQRAAAEYGRQLRAHVEHEERVLWPLALELLDEEALGRVQVGFGAHGGGLGTAFHQRRDALGRQLFGGSSSSPPPSAAAGDG